MRNTQRHNSSATTTSLCSHDDCRFAPSLTIPNLSSQTWWSRGVTIATNVVYLSRLSLPPRSGTPNRTLKPLSWLQFLHPEEDPTYTKPPSVPAAELETWKSGKRGTYFKKRRRRERCEAIVDETRAGGFEGLVIASNMDAATILPHAVPLVRGGGHVVIYSPNVEPLVKIMDLYSKERRSAYIQRLARDEEPPKDNFPVDPRLLLAPTLQTSRVRESQVLPGRTHPMMTSKGGVEGYVFTARKVIPLEGGVEARGTHGGKKRKVEVSSGEEVKIGSESE